MELLNRHSAAGFLRLRGARSRACLASRQSRQRAWQQQRSKLVVQRDIGGISSPCKRYPGPASTRLCRIKGVPPSADKRLEPCVGVHGLQAEKVAHCQTGGYADGATQSNAYMRQIAADPLAPLIHLDSLMEHEGRLYASHSNYPVTPMTSSVEIWDAATMEHVATHSFGIYRGSLTWLDRHGRTRSIDWAAGRRVYCAAVWIRRQIPHWRGQADHLKP